MAALLSLSAGFTAVAADEVPEARLVAPLNGTEAVYQIIVMWGGVENVVTQGTMKATITTPSGVSHEYTGQLAQEYPGDVFPEGGAIDYYDAFQVRNLNWDPVAFTGGYTEEGRYTVTIPQGTVKVNGIDNPAATLYFTVSAPGMGLAESTPTNGNFVSAVDVIELTWGTTIYPDVDEENRLIAITINGEPAGDAPWFVMQGFPGGWEPFAEGAAPVADTESGDILMIDLSEIVSWDTTGVLQFTLPAEIVKNEAGKYNASQNFEYTYVLTNYSDEWSPDPFDDEYNPTKVSNNDVITVTWNDVIELNPYAETTIVAKDEQDNEVMAFFKDENMTVNEKSLALSLSGLDKSGVYTFVVPAGLVLVGNDYINGETAATYTVSAVSYSVTPREGTYASLNDIRIEWDGKELTPGSKFSNEDIKVALKGATMPEYSMPMVSIVDRYGEAVYPENEWMPNDNEGVALSIAGWWVDTEFDDDFNALPYSMTFTIPAGIVKVNGVENTEDIVLTYNIDPIYVDYTTTPGRGSMVPYVEQVVINWDGTEGYELAINPACTETVTYGPESFNAQFPVQSVTMQEDGSVLVDLGEKYADLGMLTVSVPDSYFMAVKGDVKVLLGAEDFNYKIAVYTVSPEPFSMWGYYGILDEITVACTSGEITLAGNVADIKMLNGVDESVVGVGESATATELDGFSALAIKFTAPFDIPGNARITIPAGMFKFAGVAYQEPIYLEYYVNPPLPEATVTPESGSELDVLDVIKLTWGDSPLALSDFYEYNPDIEWTDAPFTLQFGNEAPVVINDLVSIEDEIVENGTGQEYVKSSALVINFGEEPYTVAGDYAIMVPAGYVIVTDYDYAPNEGVLILYKVTGENFVDYLAPESDGYWRVYNLNGVNVLNTADGELLKTLAPGIYVVNGRKVIVK